MFCKPVFKFVISPCCWSPFIVHYHRILAFSLPKLFSAFCCGWNFFGGYTAISLLFLFKHTSIFTTKTITCSSNADFHFVLSWTRSSSGKCLLKCDAMCLNCNWHQIEPKGQKLCTLNINCCILKNTELLLLQERKDAHNWPKMLFSPASHSSS